MSYRYFSSFTKAEESNTDEKENNTRAFRIKNTTSEKGIFWVYEKSFGLNLKYIFIKYMYLQ